MIDITGPKVLVPTCLFALANIWSKPVPGLLIHALLFALISWAIIKFVFKFTLCRRARACAAPPPATR